MQEVQSSSDTISTALASLHDSWGAPKCSLACSSSRLPCAVRHLAGAGVGTPPGAVQCSEGDFQRLLTLGRRGGPWSGSQQPDRCATADPASNLPVGQGTLAALLGSAASSGPAGLPSAWGRRRSCPACWCMKALYFRGRICAALFLWAFQCSQTRALTPHSV